MINEEKFELSKEKISVSYIRFLSDYTVGLVVLAYICYYFTFEFVPPATLKMPTLSAEQTIIIAIICLILAMPIGLLINELGWFLFGTVIVFISKIWCSYNMFFNSSSKLSHHFDNICLFFQIKNKSIYQPSHYFHDILDIYRFPIKIDHIRGIHRFIRSLTLLLVIFAIRHPQFLSWGVPIALFFIVVCAFLDMEMNLRVLKYVYFVCMQSDELNNLPTDGNRIPAIGKMLINISFKEPNRPIRIEP